jgi:hypothetical protein
MKPLKKYLAILLFLAGVSGCNDDFMEKYPLDKINDQNYWKTVNDLKSYANQFYTGAVLTSIDNYQKDNASDNQAHLNKDGYIWNESTVPTSGGGWAKSDWSGIRNCNFFLQRYHTVVDVESNINTYVGEILFFKAAFYFEKLLRFGDVPWLTQDLSTSSEELYAPKNSRAEVADSIIACLDRAIAFLPETSAEGRLTGYTALALKARVCLFEGTFRKYHNRGDYERILRQSADAAKRIIESGRFELYTTGNPQDDYHAFFQLQDMSGVKEAIFSVQYEADKRQHNRVRQTRESGSGMTKDFAESFLCRTDGLPIALSSDYRGDATFMDEFENRDYRMKQIIYTPDRPIFITENGTEEFEAAPIYMNLAYTGYRMYKMYSPLAADNEYIKCTIDDCPFRYGEVLINYAEAKAELDECDQSVLDLTVNKLRDRVAMPHLTLPVPFVDPAWPQWETPVSPLINEIRRERRIELASEGFRWDDLCRWKAGKLLENEKTYLGARDPETDAYRVLYPGFTRVWYDKLYLHPIPIDELNYNPQLAPQNPGW